jgi:hypothetical protein
VIHLNKWIKELMQKACPPLKILEYTVAEEKMRKAEIEESDVRPNFAKEILEKGFVEFPVYRNEIIAPLGRGGKFCDYTAKTYGVGNLVEIMQSYGGLEFNALDRRYLKRSNPHETRIFRFYYDYEEKRYKQENNETRWEQRIEQANELLFHEEVEKVLRGFMDFYKEFWVEHVTFKFHHKLSPFVRVIDMKEFCHYLWYKCEEMTDFFTILSMFGEITAPEKDVLVESVSRLKAEIDDLHMYLNGQVFIHETGLEEFYHDHEHNNRFRRLKETIKRMFKPGFYVDPTQEELFRNVGQYFVSMVPTKHFSNEETMKKLKEQFVQQARKALLIKGKQAIESFDDLQLAFIDL